MSTTRYVLAAAVMTLTLVLIGASGATAAGTLDQTLTGNPDCAFDTFKGDAGNIGPMYQSFVPAMPTLTGADVCMYAQDLAKDPAFDLSIRRGGTFDAPGPIIATASIDCTTQDAQWLHANFDPVAVTPGETLILELNGYFGWVITCAEVGGRCDHVDPDQYPPGSSQFENGSDFLFRTYGSDEPGGQPGPAPLTIRWGNLDCSPEPASFDALTTSDALIPLAAAAGLEPATGSGCPAYGQTVTVFGRQRQWGDIDCLGGNPALDASTC